MKFKERKEQDWRKIKPRTEKQDIAHARQYNTYFVLLPMRSRLWNLERNFPETKEIVREIGLRINILIEIVANSQNVNI